MLCLISDQLDPVVKTAVSDRKLLARNGPGVFHPRFSEPGDFQPGDHPGNFFSSFYFFQIRDARRGQITTQSFSKYLIWFLREVIFSRPRPMVNPELPRPEPVENALDQKNPLVNRWNLKTLENWTRSRKFFKCQTRLYNTELLVERIWRKNLKCGNALNPLSSPSKIWTSRNRFRKKIGPIWKFFLEFNNYSHDFLNIIMKSGGLTWRFNRHFLPVTDRVNLMFQRSVFIF